jgi:hypothetical protein
MATPNQEIDPTETPLDPDVTQMQPPLSGTTDDDDDSDDERWDENEPPDRWVKDTNESRDETGPDEVSEDEDDVDEGSDDGDVDREG